MNPPGAGSTTVEYPPVYETAFAVPLTQMVVGVAVFPERSIARARNEPVASATHATVIRFPTAAMLAYPWYPSTGSRSVVRPIAIGTDQGAKRERSRKYTLPFVAS